MATGAKRAIVREVVEGAIELTPNEMMVEKAEQEAREDVELDEPEVYYNPWSPNERFRLPGTTSFQRFRAGRLVVYTQKQREAARLILSSHSAGVHPELLMGDDKTRYWVCKNCGFTSMNEMSIDIHRDLGF